MKFKLLGILLLLVNFAFAQKPKDFNPYVNPFIGTGGKAHTFFDEISIK